jgi:hypothetical protein
MDFNSLKTTFPFLAAFGAVGLLWNQIKNTIGRIWNLVVNRVELTGYAADSVSSYLWKFATSIDTGTYTLKAAPYNTKKDINQVLIGSKRLGEKYQIFFMGKVPILVKGQMNWGHNNTLTVCFLRGTIDFDKLFITALNEWNVLVGTSSNRFRIETLVGKDKSSKINVSKDSSGSPTIGNGSNNQIGYSFLSDLNGKLMGGYTYADLGKDYTPYLKSYIIDNQMTHIDKEIETWMTLGAWYKERGLIWKRNYLLYGKPGTGKTSYVRVIGTKSNLPIFRFDLSSMTNLDFVENWNKIILETPCIALFEDIDNIFEGRKNITGLENPLSFDCFLNVLSGAMPADGILTFLTTNKVEVLDPALGQIENGMASRPGRIDRMIEVKNLSLKDKRKVAENILKDFPSVVEDIMISAESLSNAQFTEKCSQLALKKMWGKEG